MYDSGTLLIFDLDQQESLIDNFAFLFMVV